MKIRRAARERGDSQATIVFSIVVGLYLLVLDLPITITGESLLEQLAQLLRSEYLALFSWATLECQVSLVATGLAIVAGRPASRILYAGLFAIALVFLFVRSNRVPPIFWGGRTVAVAVNSTLVVGAQMLVVYTCVFRRLADQHRMISRGMQYSLASLLVAITAIAIICTLFSLLPPAGLTLDAWRELFGIVVYGFVNALAALAVFFWLFPHGWRAKLMTLPIVTLKVGTTLLAEFVILTVLWSRVQMGSLFVSLAVMLTGLQVLCILLTLIPLRLYNVFGAQDSSG